MSKNFNGAAFVVCLLATTGFVHLGLAQPTDTSAAMPAIEGDPAYLCSEERRTLIREMSRTDGDMNPAVQTEEECRQQYVFSQPGTESKGEK